VLQNDEAGTKKMKKMFFQLQERGWNDFGDSVGFGCVFEGAATVGRG
jgi:hypothetical protein